MTAESIPLYRPRAVAFYRISSMKQEGNASLDFQKAQIERWASGRYEIVAWVDAIEPGTCSIEKRPRFQHALQQMDALDADTLLVYDLDRFFRNTEEGLRCARVEFLEKDRNLVSVTQNLDLRTRDGWFFFGLFLLKAENEHRTNQDRFAFGRAAKQAKGGYIGGETPYGWRCNPDTKQLEADEREQQIVKAVLNRSFAGWLPTQIANWLNEQSIPTRKGGEWTYKQIQSIINKNADKIAV